MISVPGVAHVDFITVLLLQPVILFPKIKNPLNFAAPNASTLRTKLSPSFGDQNLTPTLAAGLCETHTL